MSARRPPRRSGEARLIAGIERIARAAGVLEGRSVRVGIGDDCAVLLPGPGEEVAWHVDDQVEDVHFRRRWSTFEDVGWKGAGAALSDLAAAGARPLGVQLALQIPRDVDDRDVLACVRGFVAGLVAAGGVPLVGGNVAARPAKTGFSLSVSVLGAAPRGRALRRAGGRPGDGIFTTGPSGLARIGFLLLERGRAPRRGAPARAVARLLRPRPRLEEGRALLRLPADRRPRAATDSSDGLGVAARLLATGALARVVLEEPALGLDELARAAAPLGDLDALATALEGGEDYELVVAAPAAFARTALARRAFTRIGRIERGTPGTVVVETATGERRPVGDTGYAHR